MPKGVGLILGLALVPLTDAADERSGATVERTAVYMQAGYSSGSPGMGGPAVGGLLVRDLTPRLAVEASASYLGHGMGSSGLSASAALLVNLRPAGERSVPYLVVGGGLYRASFDMDEHLAGRMGMGDSMMDGMMPRLYGHRLGREAGASTPLRGGRSYTDPALSLGGGIRIDLGSRLYLRPDARALVVTSSDGSNTLGVFVVNLGYRF